MFTVVISLERYHMFTCINITHITIHHTAEDTTVCCTYKEKKKEKKNISHFINILCLILYIIVCYSIQLHFILCKHACNSTCYCILYVLHQLLCAFCMSHHRAEKEYAALSRQLNKELEEKRTVISNLSKQMEEHQKDFTELKQELAKVRETDIVSTSIHLTYPLCIKWP